MRNLVLLCIALAGCATAQDQCATGAYEAGRNDARFGRQPNELAYAGACAAQASAADYMAGWRIGYSETSFRQPN